jgi:hypothetical protein
MKLQPPVVQISPENPYSQDLFNRKDFGDSLASLISNIEDNIVLCIDAPWGDGKTTFAKMWTADLLRQGKHCIYFDAYEHDYSDDPYVSFCTEIISLAETAFDGISAIQKLKEDFKTKAKRIGGKLLCTGTRIGVKAFTLGIIKDSDIDALSSIKEDLADSSSVAISNYVGKAFDDYASSKESLSDFRAKLTALGAAVKEEQELPLLIVVDELDRCRPDFALSLIERIKHLFSTKNVCFVLLVNLAQLQNYVKTIYGGEVDARNYLHKFFTISTDLPSNRLYSHDNDYAKYTQRLFQHYGLNVKRNLGTFLPKFFQYYRFSLREMERCFTILALYYSQLPSNRLTTAEVIGLLAIIKLRYTNVFGSLSAGKISYQELIELTGIDKIENEELFLNFLKYLLIPEEDYKALDQNDKIRSYEQWHFPYNIGRNEIMPFLCSELKRFKIGVI